jgi:hypothetical protein
MNRYFFFLIALILFSCNNNQNKQTKQSFFSAKIFNVGEGEFGYDLYQDTAKIIHQPVIPSIEGNSGFMNENDAKKVADLMIFKLDNGISPPSVNQKELDSLNINLPKR